MSSEFEELLTLESVRQDLERRVQRMADAAGDGMESVAIIGHTRAVGFAWTDTFDAMRAEATHRALTRAIDAGR